MQVTFNHFLKWSQISTILLGLQTVISANVYILKKTINNLLN